MKQNVLIKISRPTQLYFAPAMSALANITTFFAVMLACMPALNPLIFVALIVLIHLLLIAAGRKEPHLDALMRMRGQDVKTQNKDDPYPLFIDRYASDNSTVIFKNNQCANVFSIDGKILGTPVYATYLSQIAQYGVSLRVFYKQKNAYLIVSYPQTKNFDSHQIISMTQASLSDYHPILLNMDDEITPGDVFKLMLNPLEDMTYSVGPSLSASSLLTNKNTLIAKDGMLLEQQSKKVYTSVLSLSAVQSVIDLDILKSFEDDVSVLTCITPCTQKKSPKNCGKKGTHGTLCDRGTTSASIVNTRQCVCFL